MTQAVAIELEAGFKGEVVWPGDAGYDPARQVFNAMIDKRPSMIVRPTGPADIIDAVNLAREKGMLLAIRCGGHSIAGNSVCDGGMLIDLSSLKGVRVDAANRTARANAGVLWGEFDRETQMFGLATPGGRVTTTGVGGFTLGGGYGWLSPKYGLTCDNLISADVVTADGRLVTASERENEDLFWALRGGGGNFGVVTSFEFRLHPVGPMVAAGMLIYRPEDAKAVLRGYRDYVESAPEELVTAVALVTAPPEPFVPEDMRGKAALGVVPFYIGDVAEGERAIAPLKKLGPLAVDLVQPMPYTAFQAMLDPFAPLGWQSYNRGLHLKGLPDGAIDAYVSVGSEALSPLNQAIIFRHGGEVSRIPDDANAASHRDAVYMAHPIAMWMDPADMDRELDWVRRFSDAFGPYTTGGVYLNFEPNAGEDRVRAGFGPAKFERLQQVKAKWDPGNLFRVNQNITPKA